MIRKLLAGAALGAMIAAAPAFAQNAPPLGYDHTERHAAPAPLTRAEVEKMVTEHFAMLDLNHDGVVTRGEIVDARDAMRERMMKAHRNALFDRLDKNKDGMLSRDEFAAPPGGPDGDAPPPPGGPDDHGKGGPRGMGHRPMPGMAGGHERMGDLAMLMGPHAFERADADHDGKITLAEAKAAALAVFDQIDANHDGTISPDERHAAMRAMGGQDHGPGEGRGPGRDGPDGGPPPQD